MFSNRVPASLATNACSRALNAARASSRSLIDLTLSNPTKAGLDYPDALLRGLESPDALVYEPEPLGLASARQAVAADYARRGRTIAPDQIVLTSSTSEAYSLLFKLLCAPGDAVLAPIPSYPLFEHLTRLDGVMLTTYALEYEGRWMLDLATVEAGWSARTRAVLAVNPNNPTGSCLSRAEESALARLCASEGAALILDEVFADYPLTNDLPHPDDGRDEDVQCLTFRLGGLSKSVGLPQVKLGWLTVEGPDTDVRDALTRLEFICDAYLSVSIPVQKAAPELIARGQPVRDQIAERVRGNYERLRRLIALHPALELLVAEAGWSAVLRVPARETEEEIVLELLDRDSVVVHPGFFFDFPREAFLVLSLLPPVQVFEEGVKRVADRLGSDRATSVSRRR